MDKIFNKPFAVNGARVAIPENGTENERVSFDKGFTQPYEVEAPSVDNPNGQGFNILRPEMNEALYQLSSACNFLAENIDKWLALTTENLNNITQKGRYFQAIQSQATSANNYPTDKTGYLIVFDSIIGNTTQIYKTATSGDIFCRYQNNGNWSGWHKIIDLDFLKTAIPKIVLFETTQNTTIEIANEFGFKNIALFAIARAYNMGSGGGTKQLNCRIRSLDTDSDGGSIRIFYVTAGLDATIFTFGNFNIEGLTSPRFIFEKTWGLGSFTNAIFLGLFY